jgi:hypothetical protein
MKKFFAVQCEKLLNLQKAFENRQDRLRQAFKISELAGLWLALKIGELALAGFQNLSRQLR